MTLEQIWHFTKWAAYKLRWPLIVIAAVPASFFIVTLVLGGSIGW